MRRQIAGNEKISYVFSSTYSSAYDFADDPGHPLGDPSTDGFRTCGRHGSPKAREVFVIKDVPPTQGDDVPSCLAANSDDRLLGRPT